jgi:hypothetical protein
MKRGMQCGQKGRDHNIIIGTESSQGKLSRGNDANSVLMTDYELGIKVEGKE